MGWYNLVSDHLKLTFHSYFIIAERTGRCSCCFLSYDLTSTGLAAVDAHAVQFIILPLTGAHWVPVIVWIDFPVVCVSSDFCVRWNSSTVISVSQYGTFHVLRFRIKYHRGITDGHLYSITSDIFRIPPFNSVSRFWWSTVFTESTCVCSTACTYPCITRSLLWCILIHHSTMLWRILIHHIACCG